MAFIVNTNPNWRGPVVFGELTLIAGSGTEVGLFLALGTVAGSARVIHSKRQLGGGASGEITWARVGDDLVFTSTEATDVGTVDYVVVGNA